MYRLLILILLPLATGCAVITQDPWHWMDDPALQRWVEVRAQVQGSEVRFAVPDQLKGASKATRSNLQLRDAEEPIRIEVPYSTAFGGTDVALFNWDYWWGGFFKGSGTDFLMDVEVVFYEEGANFLSMTPEEWKNWHLDLKENRLTEDGVSPVGEYVLENYRIETVETGNSLAWVVDNNPILEQKLLTYMTPVGESHMLHVSFWISEKSRNGLEADPEWFERRWAMARKILDTFEITPRPGKF